MVAGFNGLKGLDIFPTLSFNLQSGNPFFKHGILFVDSAPKGKALLALLKEIKWTPSKIIFIDDHLHYLQSVQEMTGKLGIDFVGFHYKASELISPLFDEESAAFRFRHLAEKGEWLTEDVDGIQTLEDVFFFTHFFVSQCFFKNLFGFCVVWRVA